MSNLHTALPSPSACELAAYLLHKATQTSEAITLMRLNALLYYAEACSLAMLDQELTGEPLQAWDHGPVFPSLWETLKHRGWNNLEAHDLTITTPLDEATQSLLDDVWQAYSEFPQPTLEKMIKQDAPWKEARQGLSAWDLSKRPMSKATMATFYKTAFASPPQTTATPAQPVRNTQLSQQY